MNRWHAEQAVYLYENLFVVSPGGFYTGVNPPTPEQIASQQNLLALARKNLEMAKQDYQEIRADFTEQFGKFEAAHGRQPTRRELVVADLQHDAKNEDNVDDQLDVSAGNWNAYLAFHDAAQGEEAAENVDRETDEIVDDVEAEDEVDVEGKDDTLDFGPLTPPHNSEPPRTAYSPVEGDIGFRAIRK